MCVRVFLPLTPSPPGPKLGSVAPQAAVLALGQDTVKSKQVIVEVTGKIRARGSPWCQGKVSLAVSEMCDTGHNVLECCARQGLWEWGCGEAAGGTRYIQSLPCFPG